MKTNVAVGIIGVFVLFAALLVLWGCGGGSSTPTAGTDSTALTGDGAAASGTAGDGGMPGDAAGTGDAPNLNPPPDAPGGMPPMGSGGGYGDGNTDFAPGTTGSGDAPRDHHRRWKRNFPIVGTIISLENRVMTIKPEIPEFIAQRIREHMQDSDRPWPPAPDEISLRLTADTVFRLEGEVVDYMPFEVRDKVVAWPGFSEEFDMRVARVVSDYATFARRWQAMHDGEGDRPQRDGPHFRGMMPGWGTITAITDRSITIKPEYPERMLEHWGDRVPPFDLPESMTFLIDADTKYFRDGEQVRPGSFAVGDHAFIVPRRPDDSTGETDAPIAAVVSDKPMFRYRWHHDGNTDGDWTRDHHRDGGGDTGHGGGMHGDAA